MNFANIWRSIRYTVHGTMGARCYQSVFCIGLEITVLTIDIYCILCVALMILIIELGNNTIIEDPRIHQLRDTTVSTVYCIQSKGLGFWYKPFFYVSKKKFMLTLLP